MASQRRITIGASLCGFVSGWEATTMFFLFPEIRDVLASGDSTDAAWILTITGVVSSALLLQGGAALLASPKLDGKSAAVRHCSRPHQPFHLE